MESESSVASLNPTGRAESGAQTVLRACDLLTEIARHGEQGARLMDLAGALGLSRPTVHRLVQALASRGFVQQRPSRRYGIGAALFELGLQAPSPLARLDTLLPLLQALAGRTGDTCYLMMRRGDDVLCLARAEGSFPIHANVIAVGGRRPLTTGIGGLAILATFDPAKAEAVLQRTEAELATFSLFTASDVRSQLEAARRRGYTFCEGMIMAGVSGLGVAVPATNPPSYLAVSLSAIASRLPCARTGQLNAELQRTAAELAATLAPGSGDARQAIWLPPISVLTAPACGGAPPSAT